MFATRRNLGAPPKPRNTIRVNTTPAGEDKKRRAKSRMISRSHRKGIFRRYETRTVKATPDINRPPVPEKRAPTRR